MTKPALGYPPSDAPVKLWRIVKLCAASRGMAIMNIIANVTAGANALTVNSRIEPVEFRDLTSAPPHQISNRTTVPRQKHGLIVHPRAAKGLARGAACVNLEHRIGAGNLRLVLVCRDTNLS